MALSKKDFVREAERIRKVKRGRETQIKIASRIFKKSNPKFSETRFRNYIKYGTENKRKIARMRK